MRKPCDTLLHLAWESVRELDSDPCLIGKTISTPTSQGISVSQFFAPIVCEGVFDVPMDDGSLCPIRITRAHLEEDAGKSVHDEFAHETGIDLNRAGTPLLEIVTEPDFRSAEQAVAYLKALHSLVTYLGISDGNMAEGPCAATLTSRSAKRVGELAQEGDQKCELLQVR